MRSAARVSSEEMPAVPGRQERLGLFSATILVVANMVGTGIFTTSGFIIQGLGNSWAMLGCWMVGGLFALTGALCYGELGARFPRAGGEYVFLRESFGELPAFLSGWVSLLVGFSAPIAAGSMAFAVYFLAGWGGSQEMGFVWRVQGVALLTLSPVTLLASGVIVAFSLVHSHSLFLGSRVQNALTLFKLALIMAFVILGLGWGRGSPAHFDAAPPLGVFFSGQFATSLIFITFAYSGWNAAAYMGGEISRPTRNIPLALLGGTLLVTILYLLLNLTFLYGLSSQEMSGVLAVGEKAAVALFGVRISRIFSGAIALSLLSLISAMMMTGPRVYQAMAKDGLFFPGISKLKAERATPGNAILLQAGLALFMVLTASFENLLVFIGFTLSLFSLMAVGGLMVLKWRAPAPDLPYQTWGYPFTALLFILGNLWIILFSIINRPLVSLTGLAAILSGAVFYLVFKRRARRAT
ncbi:MAG: amino acid permease [Deltaproteobacteria bacterium]|nr:amino acid permease [Deltaproteobacteria bacterium]